MIPTVKTVTDCVRLPLDTADIAREGELAQLTEKQNPRVEFRMTGRDSRRRIHTQPGDCSISRVEMQFHDLF